MGYLPEFLDNHFDFFFGWIPGNLVYDTIEAVSYCQGTRCSACAEILKAGDAGGAKAKLVFTGVGISALYKFLMSGVKLWKESVAWLIPGIKGMEIGMDVTPALLGVGFIIGPRIASFMLAGAVLGYFVLSPLIAFIGANLNAPIPPAEDIISNLSPGEIRSYYIRYIGAGAVAVGGLLSLLRACPIVFRCFKLGFVEMFRGFRFMPDRNALRTEQDIPMSVVVGGAILIAILMLFIPQTRIGLVGMLIVVLFSFFFVTVASRIVGIVGSSSSPVSGMTIATLLVTCLIFVAFGWQGLPGMIGAMSIGSVVCIAICMAGDASQDLKTGFLVGSTPFYQQIAEFIGVMIPALFMGGVLMLLHRTMVIGSDKLPAPQATLMSFVVKGVMTGTLPWTFVGFGVLIGIAVELLGISALPFAIGLYLPLSLSTPIMLGGLIYYLVQKTTSVDALKTREERGILFSSGLVAGDALVGVLIAFLIGVPALNRIYENFTTGAWLGNFIDIGSLILFIIMGLLLFFTAKAKS